MPVHELVVCPMAGTNLDTASDKAAGSGAVMPLNKPMLARFYGTLTSGSADMQDPRLDTVGKADQTGLVAKLKQLGVQVDAQNHDGVTHEFFGMGMVVGKATLAEDFAVKELKEAFGGNS